MIHKRSEREISKISASCQIVADTLIMLEPLNVLGNRSDHMVVCRSKCWKC